MIKQYKVVSDRPIEGRTFDVGQVIDLPSQIASYYVAMQILIEHHGDGDADKPDATETKPSGAKDAASEASEASEAPKAPRARRGKRGA